MVDGVLPADAAQVEKARAAAAGLSGIIAQLGELTQAEAAPLHRTPGRVDLADLAREIVASLDGLLRDSDIAATVDSPGSVHASVDEGQVARALRNVVTNAIQHSPPGGTVRIAIVGGATPEIRVIDEGTGIADEDLPYVFERFYRADRSRGRRPGSGIGLTVARELVAANGGSLSVASTGPSGTTFRIGLPAAT
jgi:two-component system sensor histidine kinase BaeS